MIALQIPGPRHRIVVGRGHATTGNGRRGGRNRERAVTADGRVIDEEGAVGKRLVPALHRFERCGHHQSVDRHRADFQINALDSGSCCVGDMAHRGQDLRHLDVAVVIVEPFDVQATILNQLGFDHEKFIYQFQGRPYRLTDVKGKVIDEILV